MRLHLAPVSAAGIALHRFADTHPRLSADSIRPYIGILGVLTLPLGFDAVFWRLMGEGIDWIIAVVLWVAQLPGAVGRIHATLDRQDPLRSAGAIRESIQEALELILEEHQDWHMLVRPHHLPLA